MTQEKNTEYADKSDDELAAMWVASTPKNKFIFKHSELPIYSELVRRIGMDAAKAKFKQMREIAEMMGV